MRRPRLPYGRLYASLQLAGASVALLLLPLSAWAGADEDWKAIVALDAGPSKRPASREEAVQLAHNHLLITQKALETFLARYPHDPHAFDAQLRLASVIAAEGMMSGDTVKINDALLRFSTLEKAPGVPAAKQADAGFRRACLVMQNQTGASAAQNREAIAAAAETFTATYPGDIRGPRLLVEAATVWDDVPSRKRDLLEEALRITPEATLKNRINDDLHRMDFVGKPLDLKLADMDGKRFDLASYRGRVLVLIFWAAESPQCLLWMREFRAAWEKMPKDKVRVVTVSLDTNSKELTTRLKALQADWPTHYDGRGWDGSVPRALGINALPTIWILDKKGVLRTLNARGSYDTLITRLLSE